MFDIRAKFQSEKVMADVYLAIALFGGGIWANVDGGGPLSQNKGRVGVARQPMMVWALAVLGKQASRPAHDAN